MHTPSALSKAGSWEGSQSMQPDVSDQRGHFRVIFKAWIFLTWHDFGFGLDSSGCGCFPSDYVSHVGERVLAGIHL